MKTRELHFKLSEMSEGLYRTLAAISDPRNRAVFSADAAVKAFSHVPLNYPVVQCELIGGEIEEEPSITVPAVDLVSGPARQ